MKIEIKNKLLQHLKVNVPDSVFIQSSSGVYSYGDVASLSEEFIKKYSQIAGKCCAVISDNRESLALLLPSLDSICKKIFLQPQDLKTDIEALYDSINVDYVVYLSTTNVSVEERSEQRCKGESAFIGNCTYVLSTSGTSGQPKIVEYTLDALLATSQKNSGRGREFCWGLLYDLNRFAGLQVYLQATVAGSTLVVTEADEPIDLILQRFKLLSVNCMSATPSFWRKFLMSSAHKEIRLKRITLGGEISTQSILTALMKSFPDACVTHIYASTEAGVGFSVKDGLEGFPLSLLESDSTCKLKVQDGLLWIKNENGATKLLSGNLQVDSDGYVNTGDLVVVENGRVKFLGRDSGSINVGGNKVMPEKVESVLEECHYVNMANVYAKKNSVLGSLVSADIVLSESGQALSKQELKKKLVDFCALSLDSHEIPVFFNVVSSVDFNSTGKKIRG